VFLLSLQKHFNEFLNVTNEMQLLENFIINSALHVSGTLRPSSGAYGNCTCSLWWLHAVFSPHIG